MSDLQKNLQDAYARFDRFAAGYLQEANLAGMSVALTGRDELLYSATYGYANLDALEPVKPETLFEIGSISKSFTALSLLQEHEAGRLKEPSVIFNNASDYH